jgi:hypothetical protein
MHPLEAELRGLANPFPDMLLMGKMICQPLARQRHPTKTGRISHCDVPKNLD